jgi:hypothetical protein
MLTANLNQWLPAKRNIVGLNRQADADGPGVVVGEQLKRVELGGGGIED